MKIKMGSFFLLASALCPASTMYTVTLLPGNATAINNNGVIAGNNANGTLYIDNNGTITNIGTLGVRSVAYGINDSNEVGGYYYLSNGYYRGFVYTGSFADIGDFGGPQSGVTSINDSGYATGFANDPSTYQAIFYKGPGQLNELPDIGIQAEAQGINASGQITGAYDTAAGNLIAFLYSGGAMHSLGTLGGVSSYGLSINDSGVVVGESQTASGLTHAFIDVSGTMTDLGTLGGTTSYGYYINKFGTVVGFADLASGAQRASVDFGNNQWVDLNTLLTGSSVTLNNAYDVNSSGQILASDAAGNTYLLTPTPEPGTFALVVGFGACAAVIRRRARA